MIPIASNLTNCNLEPRPSLSPTVETTGPGTIVWPVALISWAVATLPRSSEPTDFCCHTPWKPCLPLLANHACAPPSRGSLNIWRHQVSGCGHRELWGPGGNEQPAQIQLWPRSQCAQVFRGIFAEQLHTYLFFIIPIPKFCVSLMDCEKSIWEVWLWYGIKYNTESKVSQQSKKEIHFLI